MDMRHWTVTQLQVYTDTLRICGNMTYNHTELKKGVIIIIYLFHNSHLKLSCQHQICSTFQNVIMFKLYITVFILHNYVGEVAILGFSRAHTENHRILIKGFRIPFQRQNWRWNILFCQKLIRSSEFLITGFEFSQGHWCPSRSEIW
jgi:hypothetical protein